MLLRKVLFYDTFGSMKLSSAKTVMDLLKTRAKFLGVTQQQIAKKFSVSLPTVKRWFAAKGVSIETLTELMEMLDLGWDDIAIEFDVAAGPEFVFTFAQEKLFAANPSAHVFFDLLLDGSTPYQIEKKFRLQKSSTRKYLRALENVGLIDVLPGDKIKIKVKGEAKWMTNGPLAQRFRESAIQDFMDHMNQSGGSLRFGIHNLLPEDKKDLKEDLEKINSKVLRAERRARLTRSPQTRSYGLMFAFEPYDWTLSKSIENI